MLFNSTLFLGFLVVVVYKYYLLTPHYRRWFLLLASYSFYWAWSVPYSILMVGYTLLAYKTARIIEDSTQEINRTTALITFLAVGHKTTQIRSSRLVIGVLREIRARCCQESPIRQYGLLKMVIARNEAISGYIFHSGLPPGLYTSKRYCPIRSFN